MLERCKIQKTLRHCLFSTTTLASNQTQQKTLTKLIIEENLKNISQQTQYAFVCELINCIQNLINLEYVLSVSVSTPPTNINQSGISKQATKGGVKVTAPIENDDYLITKSAASEMNFFQSALSTSTQTSRYIQYLPIINQSMFLSSILYYLRHLNLFEFHLPILNLIRNSLPFTGTSWNAFIIEQLGTNLINLVSLFEIKGGKQFHLTSSNHFNYKKQHNQLPNINIPDFFVVIIKQLTCLLHFSLLITSSATNTGNLNKSNNSNSEIESMHEFQNDALFIKSNKQVNNLN